MKYSEKADLVAIVVNIPESELGESVSALWKRYGYPDFTYQTFGNYLKALRRARGVKSDETKVLG